MSHHTSRRWRIPATLIGLVLLVAAVPVGAAPRGSGQASASTAPLAGGIWKDAGFMTTPRVGHTATLLQDGRVLVTGGCNGPICNSRLSSAELYDPTTRMWSATAGMSIGRVGHTATLLQDGRVLVAGGCKGKRRTCVGFLASAELYDPTTGTWSRTDGMTTTRENHTATLLKDGRVLVAGGCHLPVCGTYLSSAELYDPETGHWSPTGSMTDARAYHTATRLQDGRVLVAGGYPFTASAEVYDPATGNWTATGSLTTARSGHTATLLLDGRVLVAGGDSLGTAEVYDPTTGTWSATGSLHDARSGHTATRLRGGKVLVAGGCASSGCPTMSAEVYFP